MVDLHAKPFYLDDSQIAWVEDTLSKMSLDEKVGQLFGAVIFKSRALDYGRDARFPVLGLPACLDCDGIQMVFFHLIFAV